MRKFISIAVFCLIALFTFKSSAQEGIVTKTHDKGYSYEFEDDPLSAGGFGPNDSRIRIRRGAQRSTLIKPRTQFITELIQSVEEL